MFLRSKIRRKDGKEHRAWSVVENRRVHDGRVVQRQVFYLGEINDSQRAAWSKAIEVFDDGARQSKQIALFPEDLLAIGRGRASVQGAEERSRGPPHLSSARNPNRSPYFFIAFLAYCLLVTLKHRLEGAGAED